MCGSTTTPRSTPGHSSPSPRSFACTLETTHAWHRIPTSTPAPKKPSAWLSTVSVIAPSLCRLGHCLCSSVCSSILYKNFLPSFSIIRSSSLTSRYHHLSHPQHTHTMTHHIRQWKRRRPAADRQRSWWDSFKGTLLWRHSNDKCWLARRPSTCHSASQRTDVVTKRRQRTSQEETECDIQGELSYVTILPHYTLLSPPQTLLMIHPPALWSRPWTTLLWGCSAPGLVAFPPPPSGGPETWYYPDVKICKPVLPPCCWVRAWRPTTACLSALVHIRHSKRRQRAACTHVRRRRIFFKTCFFNSSKLLYVTRCLAPDVPPAEPVCFAYVTNNQQYLMLSCSWDGGAPKALVWWEGPGGQSKGGEENSNILILRYGTAHSGLPYTCHAKHPLLVQTKTCRLTLGQRPSLHTLLKALRDVNRFISTSRGSCTTNPA